MFKTTMLVVGILIVINTISWGLWFHFRPAETTIASGFWLIFNLILAYCIPLSIHIVLTHAAAIGVIRSTTSIGKKD